MPKLVRPSRDIEVIAECLYDTWRIYQNSTFGRNEFSWIELDDQHPLRSEYLFRASLLIKKDISYFLQFFKVVPKEPNDV